MKVYAFNETNDTSVGWLSNMSAYQVLYNGDLWPTAEHLFQYMRYEKLDDVEYIHTETDKETGEKTTRKEIVNAKTIKAEILATGSPLVAKWLAKKYSKVISSPDVKFDDKQNEAEKLRIAIAQAQAAKQIGKRYRKLMTTTREHDIKLMDKVVRLKLAYNPDLIRRLISTDGEIIEDVTTRNTGSSSFWGAAKQEDGTWVGANALGVIWMTIREDLKNVLLPK
jgi:predicted NAD-dependent protein-ADP-ribosyltransferase YbiA (DUF1768 family)